MTDVTQQACFSVKIMRSAEVLFMEYPRLEDENVSAYYDTEKLILFVVYGEILSPEITAKVYEWVNSTSTPVDVEQSRGSIYDFRTVKRFSLGNLPTVQQKSLEMNRKDDLSHHPVALLIDNFYQESMVKTAMQMTPGQERKRIVHSIEEAYAFINEFQGKRASQSDSK
jgi:hypothetical protein